MSTYLTFLALGIAGGTVGFIAARAGFSVLGSMVIASLLGIAAAVLP